MSNVTLKQAWAREVRLIREHILKQHAAGKLDREAEKRFVRQELLRIAEED